MRFEVIRKKYKIAVYLDPQDVILGHALSQGNSGRHLGRRKSFI